MKYFLSDQMSRDNKHWSTLTSPAISQPLQKVNGNKLKEMSLFELVVKQLTQLDWAQLNCPHM